MMTKNLMMIAICVLAAVSVPLQNAQAWGRFNGGIHPGYDPHFRRDPVIVHREYVNGGHGCIGCGVGAAAVVGLIAGAAIATAVVAQPTQTVVVQGPPYGTQVGALPRGCNNMNVNGVTYYRCGPYWYQPYMGGNGVYYTLIPPPM
jgi:hypothetical protein